MNKLASKAGYYGSTLRSFYVRAHTAWLTSITALFLALSPLGAMAQQASQGEQDKAAVFRSLQWQRGPTTVTVAGNSTLVVPQGYVFLDEQNTTKFLELNQNIGNDSEVLVAPESLDWTAYLSFDPSGYVKDDETIDAAALLASLKEGTAAANAGRRQRGWTDVNVIGWASAPSYNRTTKRLEWATLLESQGRRNANFSTKILGRQGHTSVVLVANLENLSAAQTTLNTLLENYRFNSGETYAEWKEGDKIAEYGLGALVLGGAAAVAAKKGLFTVVAGFLAGAWKFLLAGLLAASGWLRSLFKKKPG